MTHPLLQTLHEQAQVSRIGSGELDAFLQRSDGLLSVVFLAGDPDKKLETADVAVVLLELLKVHGDDLRIGLVAPDAESETMKSLAVFALPSLVFFAGEERLETLPKIQDWSVYAEALPRLIEKARKAHNASEAVA